MDAEQPLIESRRAAPKSYPILQPENPRRRQLFLTGSVAGCCPPYIFFAAFGGLALYAIGFTGLFIVFGLALAFYMLCACPVATFCLYQKSWACAPWQWATSLYAKLLFLLYQAQLLRWRAPHSSKDMPAAKMRPKAELVKNQIDYALNIAVPKGREEEFTEVTGETLKEKIEENLSSFPLLDNFEAFGEDEDPVEYVMRQVGSIFPAVYQVWDDKQSDKALTRLCLYGLGAHRVEVDGTNGGKKYVVRSNALSALPVRAGFEHYGGDAYFDSNWNPLMIIDNGLQKANLDGSPNPIITKPGDPGWDRAKFRFRSSLFTLVTLVDHLFGIHLQAANMFVTALREQFSPDHPLRRFFTPFTFQTITVNSQAANNLVKQRSIGPRNFALSDTGMNLAYGAAASLLKQGMEVPKEEGGPMIDREEYVAYLKKKGIDTEYHRQSAQIYGIMKRFLRSYMEYYYPTPEAVAADPELQAFMAQFTAALSFVTPWEVVHPAPEIGSSMKSQPTLDPQEYTERVISALTSFMFVVTAGHEQVGAVEVYAQDVSFCSFKWTPGALIGTKQTATAQALLMSFTSTPMPKLMGEDWTHLFPSPAKPPKQGVVTAKESFAKFQQELEAFSKQCDEYNNKASSRQFPDNFPLYVCNPKLLETSISV